MDLLTDPIVSIVRRDGRRHAVCLPAALALCMADDLLDWPCLRPHQGPAWHMFLVQLGVLASQAAGGPLPRTEEAWRHALRCLSPNYPGDEPWRLVVDDWCLPAFMQPPLPDSGRRSDYKRATRHADAIDMLVTARNHDLKSDKMAHPSPEDWVFALVSLQTSEGSQGSGNYGVARMNKGFGSRPMLRCHADGLGPGGQIRRDIEALLKGYESWLDQVAEAAQVGLRGDLQPMLWLLPWDGQTSLGLDAFHPLAIEVCRRIRLQVEHHVLWAWTAGSKVARVAGAEAKGNIGDPWAPIELKESKAFTLTAEGYSYRRMVQLLDPKQYRRPRLAQPTEQDRSAGASVVLQAAGLARGQGKTEGFHHRSIRLSPTAAQLLADDAPAFTARAAQFALLAGNVGRSALRPALIQVLQGKDTIDLKKPSNDALTAPWIRRFDERVDRCFFQALDESLQAGGTDEQAERDWSQRLKEHAETVFEDAVRALPGNLENLWLAQARGIELLKAALWKQLPALRASVAEESPDDAT